MKRVILLLLVLCVILVGCQMYLKKVFMVQGTVVDDQTDEPIVSVEVSIVGYQYAELTNVEGDYILEVGEGTWDLKFEKEGYEPKTVQVTDVGPNNPRVQLITRLVPIPTGDDWIVGVWVPMDGGWVGNADNQVSWPGSVVIEFQVGGSYAIWNYYDLSEGQGNGTWSLEGTTLTWDGASMEIIKDGDDEFSIPDMGGFPLMRQGTEPSIFSETATPLYVGPTGILSIMDYELQLYFFDVLTDGDHVISWIDFGNDPELTGDVGIYVFDANYAWLHPKDKGEPQNPRMLTLNAGQKIFIIVSAFEEGTYRIIIQPPS